MGKIDPSVAVLPRNDCFRMDSGLTSMRRRRPERPPCQGFRRLLSAPGEYTNCAAPGKGANDDARFARISMGCPCRFGDPGAASYPGRITPSRVLAHRASPPHAEPRSRARAHARERHRDSLADLKGAGGLDLSHAAVCLGRSHRRPKCPDLNAGPCDGGEVRVGLLP